VLRLCRSHFKCLLIPSNSENLREVAILAAATPFSIVQLESSSPAEAWSLLEQLLRNRLQRLAR
jgi:hypothetical protein